MATISRSLLFGLMILALLACALSCSKTAETAKLKIPAFYSEANLNQAMQVIEQGYGFLENGDLQGALAQFAIADSLVPNGIAGAYHSMRALAANGDKENAMATLTRLIDGGYDRPDQLVDDPDLAAFQDDEAFKALVARARANYSNNTAAFVNGLPEYPTPPQTFATEEELAGWTEQQNRLLQLHGRFWTAADFRSARLDFLARRLAALRELKKSDTAFDVNLERVRASASLGDFYSAGWGHVTDLIVKEADAFLKSSPAVDKAAEVNYLAGFALSMQYAADDTLRMAAYQRAQGYLSAVPAGTLFAGAARATEIVNRTHQPNADKAEIGAQLKSVIDEHPGDVNLYRVISTQFANEAAQYLWPIPIDMPDLKGKNASLTEYNGRVLMIDFWATWCGPCRGELPNLVEVYKELHPKGFEVLSISLDYAQRTPLEALNQWIDSAGMNWRHIYDGAGWNTELVRRYFVSSIPATFLIGKDGSLVAMGDALRGEQLRPTVAAALGI